MAKALTAAGPPAGDWPRSFRRSEIRPNVQTGEPKHSISMRRVRVNGADLSHRCVEAPPDAHEVKFVILDFKLIPRRVVGLLRETPYFASRRDFLYIFVRTPVRTLPLLPNLHHLPQKLPETFHRR